MFSGFSTKTRTIVNGFPPADPAVRVRAHPARASVQHFLVSAGKYISMKESIKW